MVNGVGRWVCLIQVLSFEKTWHWRDYVVCVCVYLWMGRMGGMARKAPADIEHSSVNPCPGEDLRGKVYERRMFPFSYPHHIRWKRKDIDGVVFEFNSRRNRKGRFMDPKVHNEKIDGPKPEMEKGTSTNVASPSMRLWGFKLRNVSWWLAFFFMAGSFMWMLNGCYGLGWFSTNQKWGGPITGYFGGALFVAGAYFGVLEVLNSPHKVYTGYDIIYDNENGKKVRWLKPVNTPYPPLLPFLCIEKLESPAKDEHHEVVRCSDEHCNRRRFRWFGVEEHSPAFVAAMLNMIGATLYCVPAILDTPTFFDSVYYLAYWVPQIISSVLFALASCIYMAESSGTRYGPRFFDLGYESGLWNLIGSLGFLLSAIFGILQSDSPNIEKYGVSLSGFLGSTGFFIGSYFSMLECLNQHSISVFNVQKQDLHHSVNYFNAIKSHKFFKHLSTQHVVDLEPATATAPLEKL